MKLIQTKNELLSHIRKLKKEEKTIGFVPTMGALHEGHLSLVNASTKTNDITIVSIFVNPIQFNNNEDLKKYPRNLDEDLKILEKVNCNIVFNPDENEMYPDKMLEKYDLGGMDKIMEGEFRPGHFQGVAVVVKKLFDLVQPDNAYFGNKDFQQLSIIKYIVNTLKLNVNIVSCDTIRDEDGLAKSSRNLLLDNKLRPKVAVIPKTLFYCRELKQNKSISEIKNYVSQKINEVNDLKLEYFEIVDGITLKKLKNWSDSNEIVACIAVWAGNVRLIDNISL